MIKNTYIAIAENDLENLETVLNKAVQNAGYNGMKKIDVDDLNAIDSDISKNTQLTNVNNNKDGVKDDDSKESKATFVAYVAGNGMNETAVAKALAAEVDAYKIGKVLNANVEWSKLPEYSKDYKDSDGETFWYDFAYAANIAVVELSDAVNGQTSYVVAVTVTRTPTQTYKHA